MDLCLLLFPCVSVTLLLVVRHSFGIWASLKLGGGGSFSTGPHSQQFLAELGGPGKEWGSHCECPEVLHVMLLTAF